jgi:hypothetical protein
VSPCMMFGYLPMAQHEAAVERIKIVHPMRRTAWAGCVAVCSAVAVCAIGGLVAEATTVPALTPMIPAYYPATGGPRDPWTTAPPAAKATRTPAIEVMNADSGPGTSIGVRDPTASGLAAYRAAIVRAHRFGSSVYGYVWTNYSNRGPGPQAPVVAIKMQITQWVAHYRGIDGIFFDGVSDGAAGVGFYRTIDVYAHAKGLRVIFNPGTVPARSLMAIDATAIVVDFEGAASAYLTTRFPSWTWAYPANRFANLVYAARAGTVSTIATRARREHVGHLYVTNLRLPNPYGSLAGYFRTAELPALAAKRPRGRGHVAPSR